MRPGEKIDYSTRMKKEKQIPVPATIHFNFLKPGLKLPDQPSVAAMEIIKEKKLERHLELVSKVLFLIMI